MKKNTKSLSQGKTKVPTAKSVVSAMPVVESALKLALMVRSFIKSNKKPTEKKREKMLQRARKTIRKIGKFLRTQE